MMSPKVEAAAKSLQHANRVLKEAESVRGDAGNDRPVKASELGCLNTWPLGTVGHDRERRLIDALNALCHHHGYGRVPQLAADRRGASSTWNSCSTARHRSIHTSKRAVNEHRKRRSYLSISGCSLDL